MIPMAESKRNDPKQHKSTKQAGAAKNEAQPKRNSYLYAAIAVIIVAALALILLNGPIFGASVPFSTFKSGFQSASRVSVTATFSNQSQYEDESPCFTSLIQVIARSRKASTIDFFIINQANATCTYSNTGLGGSVSLSTTNSSHCLGIARSEPAIFLNYSSYNHTFITTRQMFVYGNSQYMASCPIEVELN